MLISFGEFETFLMGGIKILEIMFHQYGSHALINQFQSELTNLPIQGICVFQEKLGHSVTSTTQFPVESVESPIKLNL